jgi:hypothetical protein
LFAGRGLSGGQPRAEPELIVVAWPQTIRICRVTEAIAIVVEAITALVGFAAALRRDTSGRPGLGPRPTDGGATYAAELERSAHPASATAPARAACVADESVVDAYLDGLPAAAEEHEPQRQGERAPASASRATDLLGIAQRHAAQLTPKKLEAGMRRSRAGATDTSVCASGVGVQLAGERRAGERLGECLRAAVGFGVATELAQGLDRDDLALLHQHAARKARSVLVCALQGAGRITLERGASLFE